MTRTSEARTEIEATVVYTASHDWPEAHSNRKYLRHPHVHDFRITAWAVVGHGNRDIEFHDFRDRLRNNVHRLARIQAEDHGVIPYAGHKSCEHMAEEMLKALPEATRVRVMEDDYVGATVTRGTKPIVVDRTEKPSGKPHPEPLLHGRSADFVRRWSFKQRTTRPLIVTLCGSTKFKDEFREAEARLEGEGVCVFTVGFFAHADGVPISEEGKQAADELHKWKIAMSDRIYVVNPGGYIGESTKSEIRFAKEMGVPIDYLVTPRPI